MPKTRKRASKRGAKRAPKTPLRNRLHTLPRESILYHIARPLGALP